MVINYYYYGSSMILLFFVSYYCATVCVCSEHYNRNHNKILRCTASQPKKCNKYTLEYLIFFITLSVCVHSQMKCKGSEY